MVNSKVINNKGSLLRCCYSHDTWLTKIKTKSVQNKDYFFHSANTLLTHYLLKVWSYIVQMQLEPVYYIMLVRLEVEV